MSFKGKKGFFEKVHFLNEKVKTSFSSLRIKPLKYADKPKGTPCHQGQLHEAKVLAKDLYFQAFSFYGKFFYVGQDGAKRCDAPQHGACGGSGRALHATGGGLGVLPKDFFCKYMLLRRAFRVILKAPRKKALHQGCHDSPVYHNISIHSSHNTYRKAKNCIVICIASYIIVYSSRNLDDTILHFIY